MTEKVLASHLRELETDGVVHRVSYDEVPPRVEYSLTEDGMRLNDGAPAAGRLGTGAADGIAVSATRALCVPCEPSPASGTRAAPVRGSTATMPGTPKLMNPMAFLAKANPRRAKHWWIRVGTKDSDTSLTVVGHPAAKLENLDDDIDAALYRDGGHGANEDAADFIKSSRRRPVTRPDQAIRHRGPPSPGLGVSVFPSQDPAADDAEPAPGLGVVGM